MTTPTPRTDAALEWVRPAGADCGPPNEQYVCADFARTLERELATERAHRMELTTFAKRMVAAIRKLNRNDSLSYLVMDYLMRNKLDGEPMRAAMKEGAK